MIFFSSVFSIDNGSVPAVNRLIDHTGLDCVSFTPDSVYRALCKLKDKTSRGPDGYSSSFLKSLAPSIALPLCLIFASSFENGSLSSIWRTAVVTPVFKKGVSSDVNNYRPISLTCCCCKLMESIIKDQMLSYLIQNNLITKQQHGFLARHSTCTQLLE